MKFGEYITAALFLGSGLGFLAFLARKISGLSDTEVNALVIGVGFLMLGVMRVVDSLIGAIREKKP